MADMREIPSLDQLEAELRRVRQKKRRRSVAVTIIFGTVTLLAACVLAASLWLPILEVYGTSMEPTYQKGDHLVALRTEDWGCGDVIAFYHNNTVQIRRLIAGPGDLVEIDDRCIVSVNGTLLPEPYLTAAAPGQCDLEFPCQVPEGCWFVLGDNRSESIDSRSSVVGFVTRDRIIGRILFRLWPITETE